ncbi:MAG: methylmalonyl-CoA epimerase [Solirubrobacteraceae bacterium]
MFERVDHIGIAVEELDDAVERYRDSFEMELLHREVLADDGVEAALMGSGGARVELLAPLEADTPVGRFLARRGPGIHHVAYAVTDIDATLAELAAREVELIDVVARPGLRDSRVAFVHPRASGGVLSELVQAAPA